MITKQMIEEICFGCDYDDQYQLVVIKLKHVDHNSNTYQILFFDKETKNLYQVTVLFDKDYHVKSIIDDALICCD